MVALLAESQIRRWACLGSQRGEARNAGYALSIGDLYVAFDEEREMVSGSVSTSCLGDGSPSSGLWPLHSNKAAREPYSCAASHLRTRAVFDADTRNDRPYLSSRRRGRTSAGEAGCAPGGVQELHQQRRGYGISD